MILISNSATATELGIVERAVEVGRAIHRRVAEEGKADGSVAYLYHDGRGKAWFEKFDRKTGRVNRIFSPGLANEIKNHVYELKIYARIEEDDGDKRRALEFIRATPPPL